MTAVMLSTSFERSAMADAGVDAGENVLGGFMTLFSPCVCGGGNRRGCAPAHGFVEIEVGRCGARNQSGASVECQIVKRPFDQDDEPALELHEVQAVNERPDHPRWESRDVSTEYVCDCPRPADDGEASLVDVLERSPVGLATADSACDVLRGVRTLLHRNLGYAWKRFAIGVRN